MKKQRFAAKIGRPKVKIFRGEKIRCDLWPLAEQTQQEWDTERKRLVYSNADAAFNKFMQNEIKWMRYLDERTMLCMKVYHQHPNILWVNKLAATSAKRWCYRTTKSKNIKAICILRFFSYLFSRNFSPSWRPRPICFPLYSRNSNQN